MVDWLNDPEKEKAEKAKPRHKQRSPEDISILASADPTLNLPTPFLSYSQINLWMMCPNRYYRKYVLNQRQPSSSNLVHGRAIHGTVETLLQYKIDNKMELPPRELYQDTISDYVASAESEVEGWDPKVPDITVFEESARELVGLYYDYRLRDVKPRAVEIRLTGLLRNRFPFQGFADLIEQNPMAPTDPSDPAFDVNGSPVRPGDTIIDLKCTGRKYGKHRVENSLQLTLYALLTGLSHVGYDLLVQKKNSEFVAQRAERSDNEKAHALDVVETVAESISKGDFPLTDPENYMCSKKWCPYFSECRGKKR